MKTTTFISQEQLDSEFAFDLSTRHIEQKFLYTGIGAQTYYDSCQQLNEQFKDVHCDFFGEVFSERVNGEEKVLIVSLGCGNCYNDKYVLESIKTNNTNIHYIGIDVSQEMLAMGEKMLGDLEGISISFIRADYTKLDFKTKLKPYLEGYDIRFFWFLGNTFCTSIQTLIADSLYNMMLPQDYLWLDINTRIVDDAVTQLKLFEKYSGNIDSETTIRCYCSPILEMDSLLHNGTLIMETQKEESVGSLCFNFMFKVVKKTIVEHDGEIHHFLPGELIHLIKLRNYHLDTFVHFLQEHQFRLAYNNSIKQNDLLDRTWFLFQKQSL